LRGRGIPSAGIDPPKRLQWEPAVTEPELLLAHRDFVRAVAAEIVGDVASLDDVEQETLIAAWQRGGEATRSWRGFLATLARNFARQFRRGERRRREREEAAATRERTPSVAEVVAREEQRRAVVVAVLALEEPERGAVLLRFYEGLPPREIARRLAIPVETARTRVKRGVERLRARLLAREEGEPRRLLAWLVPLARPLATTAPVASQVALLAAAGIVLAALSWPAFREGGWFRRGRGGAGARGVAPTVAHAGASAKGKREETADATRMPEAAVASPAAEFDDKATTRKLRGRVVDARQAPVADARVYAWPTVLTEPVALDDLRATKSSSGPVTSGADGRFELPVLAELDRCTLFATGAGRSPGTVVSADPERDATIVLEDDDVLVGTVTDARGDAIEGARLHGFGLHGGARLDVEATTGPDGSYRLPYPTADRAAWQGDSESWIWWVEATAAGFAPRMIQRMRDLDGERPPAEVRCDFVLLRGATLRGSVVDAQTNGPIADARVVLVAFSLMSMGRNMGGTLPMPHGERVVGESRSDEAGLFVIDHMPANPPDGTKRAKEEAGEPRLLQVYVVAAGYAPGFATVPELQEDGSDEKRIALWRPARIAGRVVDVAGRPLAHVHVAANEVVSADDRRAGRQSRFRTQIPPCVDCGVAERVVTDTQGHYEIDGLPANEDAECLYRVALDDYDWTTRRDESDAQPGVELHVRTGAAVSAPDLVGVPQRSIVLDVVDEAGHPVAGALVRREPRSSDERTTDTAGRVRWIEHDFYVHKADGSFEHFDLIRLRIARRGFATLVTDPIKPSVADPEPIRMVIARGHTLRGTVVDPLQRPAPHAGVTVWRRPPTPEERAHSQSWSGDLSNRLADAATDSDGGFLLDELPGGSFFVEISPPLGWKGRRPGAAASFSDVPVDGAPLTLRLADE
jgi:RNA polymerase sigma-70 factor (ECF subfamily)